MARGSWHTEITNPRHIHGPDTCPINFAFQFLFTYGPRTFSPESHPNFVSRLHPIPALPFQFTYVPRTFSSKSRPKSVPPPPLGSPVSTVGECTYSEQRKFESAQTGNGATQA